MSTEKTKPSQPQPSSQNDELGCGSAILGLGGLVYLTLKFSPKWFPKLWLLGRAFFSDWAGSFFGNRVVLVVVGVAVAGAVVVRVTLVLIKPVGDDDE